MCGLAYVTKVWEFHTVLQAQKFGKRTKLEDLLSLGSMVGENVPLMSSQIPPKGQKFATNLYRLIQETIEWHNRIEELSYSKKGIVVW